MAYLIDIINFLEFTDVDIPNPKFYNFTSLGRFIIIVINSLKI